MRCPIPGVVNKIRLEERRTKFPPVGVLRDEGDDGPAPELHGSKFFEFRAQMHRLISLGVASSRRDA